MPRGPRGGMRGGTPGQQYPNRSDIARQPSVPARVATDQTYGKATQQLQAMRTVPMAAPPTPGVPSQGAAPAPAAPGGNMPPAPSPIPPGAHGPVDRPTERPTEPVTAGAPLGPGPGPAAIPMGPSNPQNTNLSSMLAQIAQASGSQAVAALAQHAAAGGQ